MTPSYGRIEFGRGLFMHTFFINTSGKNLENYSNILEIQHETRRLVSLECPLTEWNNEEEGYKYCVHKMGELIDTYKNINNDFNLIFYIDLLSYDTYTSIPMNKHRERYACLKALRSILKHYIKCTFLEEMNDNGRYPQEVLLIFEENKLPSDGDETSEDGKNLIRKYTRAFLGIPAESEEIDKIVNTEGLSPEKFCEKIAGCTCSCLEKKILYKYLDQVDTFISETKIYDTSEKAVQLMIDRIIECSDDKTIESVTFATNRRAGVTNKQERTRRNLRLCAYISACVEDETVYDKTSLEENDAHCVKTFSDFDWDKVAVELATKALIYKRKYNETQRLNDNFSDMKLAPQLYEFDNQRFALDEYGKRGKTFDIVDVEEKNDEEQETNNVKQGAIIPKGTKAIEINKVTGRSLFDKEEYPPFDYFGDDFDESFSGSEMDSEQYIVLAQKLRQHHLDYLQALKLHVSDRLSNYAGRSTENTPALLRKRKVSLAEEDFDDQGRDYRYIKPGRTKETKTLKTVQMVSETAYTSALLEYMDFCAGRSVAVTDIEEQCNWFITRVGQIKRSLKKLKLVAIVLLFVIIALYTPFVALQWDGIIKNNMTIAVALLSVFIPIVLLYVVFAILSYIQHKKYREAWNEFKQKSDQVLEENRISAEKYDQLLSVYVPGLRWIYEYKLDVEFYTECCKMARAKIAHHSQKLHDRVVTVGDIMEDLEIDEMESEHAIRKAQINTDNEIDYNVSFCSGKKNRDFYSIINTEFWKTIHNKGGEF